MASSTSPSSPDRFGLMVLDWMIPAPAQGAIVIIAQGNSHLGGDRGGKEIFRPINHIPTDMETYAERHFMRAIQAGCTMPVAALARINEDTIHFKIGIYLPDGSEIFELEDMFLSKNYDTIGSEMADKVLKNTKAFNIIKKLKNISHGEH
jgi:hydroxymethylbilane synthase